MEISPAAIARRIDLLECMEFTAFVGWPLLASSLSLTQRRFQPHHIGCYHPRHFKAASSHDKVLNLLPKQVHNDATPDTLLQHSRWLRYHRIRREPTGTGPHPDHHDRIRSPETITSNRIQLLRNSHAPPSTTGRPSRRIQSSDIHPKVRAPIRRTLNHRHRPVEFEHLETDRYIITIHLGAGPVYVYYDRTKGVATAAVSHNIRIYHNPVPWSRVVANQPGLAAASLASPLSRFQTPVVSPVNGMNFALVDLTSQLDLLEFLRVTKDDISMVTDLEQDFIGDTLIGNLLYYIRSDRETPDGVTRIRQRMMAIKLEDPATASASTALTAYLALSNGGPGQRYKFEVVQGVEMSRASTMFVEVPLDQHGRTVKDIELSGQGVQVMSGEISF